MGDTENNRPLIILAHGGSFIAGVRANPSMVSLGEAFAKRGYVVASISYRLMAVWDLIFLAIAALFGPGMDVSGGLSTGWL